MTNKLMTLAEALATGRPFRQIGRDDFSWIGFEDWNWFRVNIKEAYEPIWEVLPEEKPPMRVWSSVNGQFDVSRTAPFDVSLDVTERLVEALAPYIKKELNL